MRSRIQAEKVIKTIENKGNKNVLDALKYADKLKNVKIKKYKVHNKNRYIYHDKYYYSYDIQYLFLGDYFCIYVYYDQRKK